MAQTKKLSSSRASEKSFSIKSTILPEQTAKTLSTASQVASEQISRNNQIYVASNSHASYYATK